MKRLIAAVLITLATVAPLRAEEAEKAKTGKIGWAVALGSVAVYEAWAVATHHETMSQSVQHSRTMKVVIGVGLGALSVHIFVMKR